MLRVPSPLQWSVLGLFMIAAAAALVIARAFFMPVILAFLLSLVFSPVRKFLERRGLRPGVTAAFIVIAIMAAIVLGVITLSGPVRDYAQEAPEILDEISRKLRTISAAVETAHEASAEVKDLTNGDDEPERVVVERPGIFTVILTSTPYLLAQIALTLALLFFLIASGDMFYEKVVRAIPRFSDKRRAIEIVHAIERTISRYFLTITVINAGLGLSIGLTMLALGMPNAPLFGVMAFVLNFVPYLGAVAGIAVTAIIGLTVFATSGHALLAAFAYFVLTFLEGQFVTPYAVGRRLKLNPVVVFIAVAFWGWAWSVVGMIIAVPVLITVRVFADHVPSMETVGLFLSARHEEREEAQERA